MNRKGQLGFIKIIVFAVLFIAFFSLALAPFVDTSLSIANLSALGTLGEWAIGSFNFWILGAGTLLIFMALIYGLKE
jgi:hypothetical protein